MPRPAAGGAAEQAGGHGGGGGGVPDPHLPQHQQIGVEFPYGVGTRLHARVEPLPLESRPRGEIAGRRTSSHVDHL